MENQSTRLWLVDAILFPRVTWNYLKIVAAFPNWRRASAGYCPVSDGGCCLLYCLVRLTEKIYQKLQNWSVNSSYDYKDTWKCNLFCTVDIIVNVSCKKKNCLQSKRIKVIRPYLLDLESIQAEDLPMVSNEKRKNIICYTKMFKSN